MRRHTAALALAAATLVDALQLHHRTLGVRRRGTPRMALRLDQPLLRIGRGVTNVVPAVGAVAGATAVGAAAVAVTGYGLYYGFNLVAGADLPSVGGPDWAKRRMGQLRAVGESVSLALSDLKGDDAMVLEDTWAPCLLEAREDFGEWRGGPAYTAYRFRLKQGAAAILPLELGQEVTFVGLDDRNRPVRASFPLASGRREPGYVEIVAPATGERRNQRLDMGGLTPDQKAVVDAFDQLAPNGEAAVRPGRLAFQYEGSHLPITQLTCFCEEGGALPIIQLLKESLPRGQSTIEKASVFWVNGDEDDFALYDGLEALFYKFARKLDLSCVVDAELHQNAVPAGSSDEGKRLAKRKKTSDLVFQRNEDLNSAVQPWAPGTLAVVAGPDHFVDQVVSHLTLSKCYPADCVVYF